MTVLLSKVQQLLLLYTTYYASYPKHGAVCSMTMINNDQMLGLDPEVTSPISSLLIVGNKTSTSKHALPSQTKPNICRIPESDLMAKVKAFIPTIAKSEQAEPDLSRQDSLVQLVPISDSDSNDSDSENDDEDNGVHVEMRLAMMPDMSSDSEESSCPEQPSLGEVTEDNIKLPTNKNIRQTPPCIEELN
ncbi:uncharacterized protein [Watersipora subatra]|uniref:uncharacterized protein n=1 Tax=Watersipora subatra TaxID=2589382 RepID=UPI00355B2487